MFLATEAGLKHLEVFKVDITCWDDFLKVCGELKAGKHDFECLVIDTVDHLYKYCEHYICKKAGVKHPSELGFGRGFSQTKDEFIRVVNHINMLGFGLVFLTHSKEREIKKKSVSYTYMDTSLSGTPNTLICGMCDFILYCYVDEDGQRLMRTKPTKYISAGDRTGKLPELMPFDYNALIDELDKIFNE